MTDIPDLNEQWLNTIHTHALPATSEEEVSWHLNNSILDGGKNQIVWTSNGTTAFQAILNEIGSNPRFDFADAIIAPYTWKTVLFNMASLNNTVLIPWTYDVSDYVAAVTESTQIIVVTHLFGEPFNVWWLKECLRQIDRQDIVVIEDCSQAHGAKYWSDEFDFREGLKTVGCEGDYAFFSFYKTKNIFAGEGGCVVSRNNLDNLQKHVNPALDDKDWYCDNARPHPSIFSKILPQIEHYKDVIEKRNRIAEIYNKAFNQKNYGPGTHVYHQYPLSIPNDHEYHKESPHYYVGNYDLLNEYDGFEFDTIQMQMEQSYVKSVAFLPIHQCMTNKDAEEIVERIGV